MKRLNKLYVNSFGVQQAVGRRQLWLNGIIAASLYCRGTWTEEIGATKCIIPYEACISYSDKGGFVMGKSFEKQIYDDGNLAS